MYQVVKFNVYNRQGKLVYDNTNTQFGWDGKMNNEELISDTYMYLIIVQTVSGQSIKFTGEVLLLR
jgi:gliding motility-associated-like protein